MTAKYRWFILFLAGVLLAAAGVITAVQNSEMVIMEKSVSPSDIYQFTFISQEADQGTDTDEVYYSDSFFEQNNAEYSHELARASLALSMTAFKEEYVTSFLKDMGYDGIVAYRYDQTGDEDKVALVMANKMVNGNRIVAVAVRGGKYGDEWGSNGRIGYEGESFGYHYGFHKAAEDAAVQLKEYAADNEIVLEDTAVWLTGFSRGAAAANVLGTMLRDDGTVSADKLYDYTFATPSTVSADSSPKAYTGIYNIVNPLDIVTRLPMNVSGTSKTQSGQTVRYNWDYVKYGTTLKLPAESESAQLQLVQLLENALAFATRNEQRYVENTQEQVIVPALKKAMGKGADVRKRNVGLVLVECLPGVAVFLKNEVDQLDFMTQLYVAGILSGKKSVRLEKEHWPETYWGWLVKTDNLE